MKTRLATSLLLALAASSAAAQPSPAAPAQQVQPGAPSPAAAKPAAPAASSAPVQAPPPPALAPAPPAPPHVPPPRPVYITPRGYVPPPPRYGAPPPLAAPPAQPVMAQPRAYQRPRMPAPQPRPPRVYGDAGAPVALGVGGALVWRNEDHARFGNDDFVGGLNVFASYDLWAPSRAFVLAGGFDYRHDERNRTDLGKLKDNLISADLTARLRATSWLWPHLRAGVGLAITQVSLKDRLAAIELDDRDLDVAGTFGAGFTLRTPTRTFETYRGKLSSLSLGVLVEGGYTVAKDATLTPEPARGGDVRRASPASFRAERSAAFLRIMGVIRF